MIELLQRNAEIDANCLYTKAKTLSIVSVVFAYMSV
uniref:Uncharacterized protein n=1 Tax=Anguilla anguilla TaxID=7936 RepID=A0A0E9P7T0_ANGAN